MCAQVLDAAGRRDVGLLLGWVPVTRAEVVQVVVAAFRCVNRSADPLRCARVFERVEGGLLERDGARAARGFRVLMRPLRKAGRTRMTPAVRSMSRCSSAIHSPGRSPVAAATAPSARSEGRGQRRRHEVHPRIQTGAARGGSGRVLDADFGGVGGDQLLPSPLLALLTALTHRLGSQHVGQ